MEEQSYKLTEEEIEEGIEEVSLSERNQKVMDSFKDFIKYNPFLIHLDLRQTGLMQPAIKLLGY